MAEITTENIKQLREETNVSIGKCKEALTEANGDMESARQILQSYSTKAAAKKSDRELGAGIVTTYIHTNKTIGVMLELLCETDFVAKNESFVNLANDIAMHAAAMGSTPESITDEPFVKNSEMTIGQLIEGAVQKLGERVAMGRMVRYSILES